MIGRNKTIHTLAAIGKKIGISVSYDYINDLSCLQLIRCARRFQHNAHSCGERIEWFARINAYAIATGTVRQCKGREDYVFLDDELLKHSTNILPPGHRFESWQRSSHRRIIALFF